MDLAELNVFLTVARERSFSRAAQKLFRTQPAVSIAIRKLEDWVGEPLFARGARSGQLTDAGQLLAGYAERMLNLREEIKRAMRRPAQRAAAANSPSASTKAPSTPCSRCWSRYRQHVSRRASGGAPHLLARHSLRAAELSPRSRRRLLRSPGAAARRRQDLPRRAGLCGLAASTASPSSGRADLADLGEEVFVAHIVESPFRNRVIQLFAKHHVPLQMRVELPTIESIKRFVQMDMGVAIVPRMCVRWEIEQGLLVEVKVPRAAHAPRPLPALSPPRQLSHAAKAMFDLLKPRGASSRADAGASAAESPGS